MAIHDGALRPQIRGTYLYSSLQGLEAALPPIPALSSPEDLLEQASPPPSPPAIPDRSPNRPRSVALEPGYVNPPSDRQLSSVDVIMGIQKGSIRKIAQLTGLTLDIDNGQRPRVVQLTGENLNQLNQAYLPSLQRLFGPRTPPATSEADSVHEVEWSDAASTKSSHSQYSHELDDEIVETISRWASWIPSKSSLESLAPPPKEVHFLQPAKYSSNAGGLQSLSSPFRERQKPPSPRRGDRQVQVSVADLSATHAPRNGFNLTAIEEELKHTRSGKEKAINPPPQNSEVIRKRSSRVSSRDGPNRLPLARPRSRTSLISCSQYSSKYSIADGIQSISGYPDPESYHEIIRGLTPAFLQMHPKPDIDSQRCISRFSIYSDRSSSPLSHTRDSLISRIRNVPTPLKVPSKIRQPMPHIAHLQCSSPPPISGDYRGQSKIPRRKHPFKIFFLFRRNSAKGNDKKSLERQKCPTESSGSHKGRFSAVIKLLSSSRDPNMFIDNGRIIPNSMRRGGGPDTPLPTIPTRTSSRAATLPSKDSASSAALSSSIQRSASQRSNAVLSPSIQRSASQRSNAAFGPSIQRSASQRSNAALSPSIQRSVSQRSNTALSSSIQRSASQRSNAMEMLGDKVERVKQHVRVKSDDERRRDELRRQIVFLGPAGGEAAARWV